LSTRWTLARKFAQIFAVMNGGDRAAWKKKLESMRQEALGKGPVRIEPNRKDDTDIGVADEDAQALSEMLQAIGSQRNKGQAERIARIDRALRKLEDDPESFGICDECGDEIAPKRLEVMPDALLCTECQGARDPRRGTTRKKITDYQ
jgi:DnaK suppressor protein